MEHLLGEEPPFPERQISGGNGGGKMQSTFRQRKTCLRTAMGFLSLARTTLSGT
jgi:hypothetical protein